MARPSRLTIAKKDIFSLFDSAEGKVYSLGQLAQILDRERNFWRLAQRTRATEFVYFLQKQGILREHIFKNAKYQRQVVRYSWGEASAFELALSIKSKGYLSHATAVALHGLTDLIPKSHYLNVEQSPKPASASGLSQKGIQLAFSRKQRQSNMVFAYGDWSVTIINGKNTGSLGVEPILGSSGERLLATNLERTLIDIVVRPAYAGGIFQVFDAYRSARDRVSTNRLVATLKKLEYSYPYHQAIGFLMERAGYGESRYRMLRDLGLHYDFYLDHGIQQPEYSDMWRLFFPKGIV